MSAAGRETVKRWNNLFKGFISVLFYMREPLKISHNGEICCVVEGAININLSCCLSCLWYARTWKTDNTCGLCARAWQKTCCCNTVESTSACSSVRSWNDHDGQDMSLTDRVCVNSFNRKSLELSPTRPDHRAPSHAKLTKGSAIARVATTFSKLCGPIPWSRVLLPFYGKKIRQVYPVWCSRLHNHTLFIKKLCKKLGVRPNLGRSGPNPDLSPVVSPIVGLTSDRNEYSGIIYNLHT